MERKEQPVVDQWRSSEEALTWANKFYQDISTASRTNSRERKHTSFKLRQAAERIFGQPEYYDPIISSWQAQDLQLGSDLNHFKVTDELVNSAKELGEKRLEVMTPQVMGEMVKSLAHNKLSARVSESILKDFFKSHENSPNSIVESLGSILHAGLILQEDPKVLELVVRITQFETDIIPSDSLYCINFILGNCTTIDDDNLLAKLIIDEKVRSGLGVISGRSMEDLVHRTGDLSLTDKYNNRMHRTLERLVKRYGASYVTSQMDALMRYMGDPIHSFGSVDEYLETASKWPWSLLNLQKHPLLRLHEEDLQGLMEGVLMLNRMKKIFNSETREFNFNTLDGYHMDIMIHEQDRGSLSEIIDYLNIKLEEKKEDDKRCHEQSTPIHGGGYYGTIEPNILYAATIRRQTFTERKTHPMQALEVIGFPEIKNIPAQELPNYNDFLADYIRHNQLRFLNRRGVSIPLVDDYPALAELGYREISFRRTEAGNDILAQIMLNNLSYGIRINGHTFEFDFEGKYFRSPALIDGLRYTFLGLLEQISCKERIKDSVTEGPDMQLEVVSRMGHLRFLPEGHQHSQRAKDLCLADQGRDLVTIDRERKIAKNTERHTTYVSPVIEKSESLPPIELNLPGLLAFRS